MRRCTLAASIVIACTFAIRGAAATLHATVVDQTGAPVRDAVIVLAPTVPVAMPAPKPAAIEQIDAEFVPNVKAVQVGTPVSFPNRDNVQHHVYSFSPAKTFELPLYRGVPSRAIVFDKPGVIVLGCNIHDWMRGYVYVSESPWFGTTDASGAAAVTNVPSGAYVARVWHPRQLGSEAATERRIEVATAPIELAWQIELKADLRPRRAPLGGAHGYH